VEEDLVDQLFNSSEKRLVRILLLLAKLAPFHSITSLEACTTLSRPEPEYDARYSYNTLQNTICRADKNRRISDLIPEAVDGFLCKCR
jgi:hypothetical protein